MTTTIKTLEKVKLRKPVLIEGLPGIGNVGRLAAGYLVSDLKMKKFAELYSSHFLPLVIMHDDSVASVLKCEFYYYRGKKHDLVVLTGDTQSISPEGHYEICEAILNFVEKIEVKRIITLGGFAEGKQTEDPKVIGAVTDKKLIKEYKNLGIDFGKNHPIGTIVGASGLLIGLGKIRNIDGICLMGETLGLPLLTDPKAAERVLQVLAKTLDLRVDLGKLEKTISEMEERIKKTEKLHSKILQELPKAKGEDIKYIG